MPGPAKTASHLKSISGTDRPDRRDPNEVTAPSFEVVREFPDPPQHLTVDGAEMWRKLGPQLVACGVLQVVDLYALEQLCFAWQRFRKKCKSDLEYSASEDGALTRLFAEFGLTPAARRRVVASITDPPKTNRFAQHGKNPTAG